MLKRLLVITLFVVLIFIQCGDDDYEIDYDEDLVTFKNIENVIVFENNTKYLIVLDNIKVNEKEVKNFIAYKTSNYVKFRDEVVVNYNEKLNQIIHLKCILLPGKKKEIPYTLKTEDEVEIEFYPINYNFLSDNIYFIDKTITEKEIRYKLYPKGDLKKLNLNELSKDENRTELDGIMIFVKEYECLEDTFEEMDFEVE